jgi:hypothetical protein
MVTQTGVVSRAKEACGLTLRQPAEAARFRELYAMLGLRTALQADGTLEVTVGATNTKGVMPCGEPGSPFTTFTLT